MNLKLYLKLSLCLGLALSAASPLYAAVTLKISASNPSSLEKRTIPIKTYLPKGIMPDNIIDAGGLEVDFDEDRKQSYVHRDVELEPRASVMYEIAIDDIWLIPEDELNDLSQKSQTFLDQLKGTDFYDAAIELKDKIDAQAADITSVQEGALVFRVGPTEHISAYDLNQETFGKAKKNLQDLEQLVLVANQRKNGNKDEGDVGAERIYNRSIKDKVLKISDSGENSCLIETAMEEEGEGFDLSAPATVSFRVVVKNPSSEISQTVPIKYYLAKDVKGRDVLESDGLKVGFDFQRGVYYVFSEGVQLNPSETRVFNIIVNNKWVVDKKELYASKVYIESMIRTSENAKEAGEAIRKLGNETLADGLQLLAAEAMTELTESKLNSYQDTQEKMRAVEKKLNTIEDMLLEAGLSPADSLLQQEKYCEEARAKGLSREEMQEGLHASTVMTTQDIESLAGTIFKGKAISASSTWRIITYIIIFLGVISSVFYFVNIRQQQSTMFDPLTGAFSRMYVLDRLREEIKIARGGKTKCSLLVMDIDKFKGINDTYGHAVGDTVLKEFVIAIRKGIRATDLIGRFGGDEFMVILPSSEKAVAHQIAGGIVRVIEGTSINVTPQLSLSITSSVGMATYPDDSGTAEDLFEKADQALYQVKRRGGNGAQAFTSEE